MHICLGIRDPELSVIANIGERIPKVKKRIYLAKANRVNLIEITGSEFYRMVSDSSMEKIEPRYFIRLTDDIDYECPEIFVEVSKEDN